VLHSDAVSHDRGSASECVALALDITHKVAMSADIHTPDICLMHLGFVALRLYMVGLNDNV